jgi:hypothetical protein
MLGHEVRFTYCLAPASKLPCRRVLDCWWETFDIKSFVRAHYTEEEIQEILAPRKEKLLSLVELIEKAKKAAKTRSDE